jgi:hypothetical protein
VGPTEGGPGWYRGALGKSCVLEDQVEWWGTKAEPSCACTLWCECSFWSIPPMLSDMSVLGRV